MELVGAHRAEFILVSADFYKLSSLHTPHPLSHSLPLHCCDSTKGTRTKNTSTVPANVMNQINLRPYLMRFVVATHSRLRRQGLHQSRLHFGYHNKILESW